MADTITKVPRTPNASAIGVILVDYSGGDQSFTKLVRGVHVNTSGNMKADFSDGSTGTLAVVAGQTYAYGSPRSTRPGPPSPATPSSDMPAQQGSWIATAYLETGTIAKGQVACLNEAGTRYVVASDTNRTAAGRRSACIAITAGDADDPGGSSFEAQYVGAVPPSITGLGAGTESLIRVSDAGVLERVAEYSTSDDVRALRCRRDRLRVLSARRSRVGARRELGAWAAGSQRPVLLRREHPRRRHGRQHRRHRVCPPARHRHLRNGGPGEAALQHRDRRRRKGRGGTDRAIITSSTQLTFGSLAGYITNVEGTGLVLRANTGGRLVVNSNILEFRDGSSNFVFLVRHA